MADAINARAATLGEKLELGRVETLSAPLVTSYLHRTARDLPPAIGVLVGTAGTDDKAAAVGHDIALHVAALAPAYATREDVPADVVAEERKVAEEKLQREEEESGKKRPEAIVARVVEGRLGAFYKENVLVEEPLAKDTSKSVGQALDEAGTQLAGFVRIRVGQR